MTYYYYLASNIKLPSGIYSKSGFINLNESKIALDQTLDLTESDEKVDGFDYPVQIEIVYGLCDPETLEAYDDFGLPLLHKYILDVCSYYKTCTIQIAHILNTHRHPLKIVERRKLLLNQLSNPKQLALHHGELLTIKKIPEF